MIVSTYLNHRPWTVTSLLFRLIPKAHHAEQPASKKSSLYYNPETHLDHEMRSDMGRRHLYLALYDDTRLPGQTLHIHWALILAPTPKYEDAHSFAKTNTLFHVTNKNGHWDLEQRLTECVRTPAMLGRVFLGRVERQHVAKMERRLADPRKVCPECAWWDCQGWVEEALIDLSREQWLQTRGVVQLDRLFKFAQRFGEEVARKGLNVGFDVPITVGYPSLRQ